MHTNGPLALLLHDTVSADARPDESDVLLQAEQVGAALAANGWRAETLPAGIDLATLRTDVERLAPCCVFNLVESLGGDGTLIHLVPALLGSIGVTFTGSGSDAIYLSSQKLLAKEWMRCHGIDTPRILRPSEAGDDSRWIVKSVWEHASLGLDDASVTTGAAAAERQIERCRSTFGGDWFAEEYIDGREFNVSVIEHDGQPFVLPIAEMLFVDYPEHKPRIVGYAAKWHEDAPEFGSTCRAFGTLDAADAQRLGDLVQRCWRMFDLRGYARVDIRLAADGTPYVLEINANPCLARDAGFVAAAAEAGMSYETLVRRIVNTARRPALRSYRRSA